MDRGVDAHSGRVGARVQALPSLGIGKLEVTREPQLALGDIGIDRGELLGAAACRQVLSDKLVGGLGLRCRRNSQHQDRRRNRDGSQTHCISPRHGSACSIAGSRVSDAPGPVNASAKTHDHSVRYRCGRHARREMWYTDRMPRRGQRESVAIGIDGEIHENRDTAPRTYCCRCGRCAWRFDLHRAGGRRAEHQDAIRVFGRSSGFSRQRQPVQGAPMARDRTLSRRARARRHRYPWRCLHLLFRRSGRRRLENERCGHHLAELDRPHADLLGRRDRGRPLQPQHPLCRHG